MVHSEVLDRAFAASKPYHHMIQHGTIQIQQTSDGEGQLNPVPAGQATQNPRKVERNAEGRAGELIVCRALKKEISPALGYFPIRLRFPSRFWVGRDLRVFP